MLINFKWKGLIDIIISSIGVVFTLIPILLIVFVFRWIRLMYLNSEEQLKQNEKIIRLLEEIKEKNEK
ncbi:MULTISPECIES: hypothetical protein [Bacillus cereus group]|uniref:DUF4083 domain-containing protein n=1 Tax=Bacillus cereus TaxID=1396 RepID=A0AA44TDQ3_BACCE|nr:MULTISPECIES: hypothetical protein [Bacillus cereus group]PFN07957.1 hypothetical protein COJ55_09080 [Bacillus cereus]PFR99238.1 hypothetical protein COK38_16435 [Bacillus cereus]PGZ15157.1 hypothetical protein COE46_16965 [Bacillus cereus]